MFYIPSSTGPIAVKLAKPDPARANMRYVRTYQGTGLSVAGPRGLPLFKPPYGNSGYRLNTGEHAWQVRM